MSHVVLFAGDETYQDIFQDFTHMASNDPDKLNRYQQYDPQRPWQKKNAVHTHSGTPSIHPQRLNGVWNDAVSFPSSIEED